MGQRIKYRLEDECRRLLASSQTEVCALCFESIPAGRSEKRTCPEDGRRCRCGVFVTPHGAGSLCSSLRDDFKSKYFFQRRLAAYEAVLQQLSEARRKQVDRFNNRVRQIHHNLTSLNAHAIQDVYDLVSLEALTKPVQQQLKAIEEVLTKSPAEGARTFMRIAKNNMAVKSEFTAMRYLDDTSTRPKMRAHSIHKVVWNVFHVFLPDFEEREIAVNIHNCTDSVLLDYHTVHCALFHIADNAVKYAMPGSELFIGFVPGEDGFRVNFDMISLPISEDEVARVGKEEGFSGRIPKDLGLAGSGLGMFLTGRLLALNGAKLEILANIAPERVARFKGIYYYNNRFTIVFQRSGGAEISSWGGNVLSSGGS